MSRDSKLYLAKSDYTAGIPLKPFEASIAVRKARPPWLTGTEKHVLWALLSRGEEIYPSFNTIAEDAGLSVSCVKKTVKRLHEKGWLVVAPGNRVVSNEYQVAVPKEVQRVAMTSKTTGEKYFGDFIFPEIPIGGVPGGLAGVPGTPQVVYQEDYKNKEEVEREVQRVLPSPAAQAKHHSHSEAISFPEVLPERSEGKKETKRGGVPGTPPIENADSALKASDFDLEALLNMEPVEDPERKYYKSSFERGEKIRLAGKSRPRPGEKEVWMTEEEYDQLPKHRKED